VCGSTVYGVCVNALVTCCGVERGETDSGITLLDRYGIRGVRNAACGVCETVIGGGCSCVSISILSVCIADCGGGIRGIIC
jgi:hypothetical protein